MRERERYRSARPRTVARCQRTLSDQRLGGLSPCNRRYNSAVQLVSLSLDTSAEIERLQIERWRQMSPAQKAAVVSGLTQAVHDLALAGVRVRHPRASAREQFLRLSLITLGVDLARRAYPEIVTTNLV